MSAAWENKIFRDQMQPDLKEMWLGELRFAGNLILRSLEVKPHINSEWQLQYCIARSSGLIESVEEQIRCKTWTW